MEDPTYRDDPTSRGSADQLSAAATEPPRAVVRAAKPLRRIDESAWLAACQKLSPFLPLAKLVGGKLPPLLWGGLQQLPGIDVEWQHEMLKVTRSPRLKPDQLNSLSKLLKSSASPATSVNEALQTLTLAYALPAIAKHDKTDLASRLLGRLVANLDLPVGEGDAAAALQQLWLGCELPLVLACLSPDPKLATSLRKSALSAEAKLAAAWLDQFALPMSSVRELLRPWLAVLVRSHELLRESETQFSEAARERLERMARHVLRLSRPDGSLILQSDQGGASDREFLTAAVLASDSAPAIAALAFGKHRAEPKPVKGMPAAPLYSPKASLAVLRNRWAAPQTQATADFSQPQVWLDLSVGNQSLLHGEWTIDVQINSKPIQPIGPWTEVCWHSDNDCDYLEIEQKFSGGWLVQRHLLLVRRDECLLLADSILNENKVTPATAFDKTMPPRIDYSTNIPLAAEVTFTPQQETREGHLLGNKKPLALVMPLAMPEWRKQPISGELKTADQQLQHSLRGNTRNLFAPLWLDLSPSRFKNPATWRQLTVGETLVVQPRDVAVGYRVQVNYSQWLVYRSLAWRGNRTLLGKNFATDFVCCRFLPNGETQDILEVQ